MVVHQHDQDEGRSAGWTRRGFLQAGAALTGGALLSQSVPASGATAETAETILHNARIVTLDSRRPTASAVAIAQGRFLAVGSNAGVLAHRGPRTQVIDARGRTVIPGLVDSHIHLLTGSLSFNLELRWDGVPTLRSALDRLREQALRTPPPQWVRVVGGWSRFQFRERRLPTLAEINAAAPDTPVYVQHLWERAFINRAGLRALGYSRNTPTPPNSELQLDRQGNPTGLLIAQPNWEILMQTLGRLPPLPMADRENSARQFMRELNRLGVTSVVDGGDNTFPGSFDLYGGLAAKGQLTTRVAASYYTTNNDSERQDFERFLAAAPADARDEYFRVMGAGEILTTAAFDYTNFSEPRTKLAPSAEQELRDVLSLVVQTPRPFRIHAVYDESISRVLNVLEALDREVPFKGRRWTLDHAEFISPRSIERVVALGGGIAVQHRIAFQGEDVIERYGPRVAAVSPPIRRMLEAGAPVGAGTDGTKIATYNPWVSLKWLVTGRTVGGARLYPKANRLDRIEALRRYTLGSAWFSGEEDRKGSIEAGKLADLAVLSENFFDVPAEQIDSLESVLTMVGGRVVHADRPFRRHAPGPLPVSPDWSPVAAYGSGHGSSNAASSAALAHAHHHHASVGAGGDLSSCGCIAF